MSSQNEAMEGSINGIAEKEHILDVQCDGVRDLQHSAKEATYDIEEKAGAEKFDASLVKEMKGKDFNYRYVQEHGFDNPMLIKSKKGLRMMVPKPGFDIRDVQTCVGSTRLVEVKRTGNSVSQLVTMKELHKSWLKEKDPVNNPAFVASVECSHTWIENFLEAPLIVRQLDLIDRVWPRHLKVCHIESAGDELMRLTYPKVQKMVYMSTKGGFTDFHVNRGGASSWVHVSMGKVVFFLVDPENHEMFASWTVSGDRKTFFGDLVKKCGKVVVEPGQTLFIPAGWLYAVYTPEDSLMLGGMFLHSFSIEEHLEIAVFEESMNIPEKHRFPFFTVTLWYVLARYVEVLTGKSYIRGDDGTATEVEGRIMGALGDEEKGRVQNTRKPRVHIPDRELKVLKAINVYLYKLPHAKQMYPTTITDPVALIRDVIRLRNEHAKDDAKMAITGQPLLIWPEEHGGTADVKRQQRSRDEDEKKGVARQAKDRKKVVTRSSFKAEKKSQLVLQSSSIKRKSNLMKRPRRQRCKVCEGCLATDCRECSFCRDMVKYGGSGIMKQSCVRRKCVQPLLPKSCVCVLCDSPDDPNDGLYECIACGHITHKKCISEKYPGVAASEVNVVKKEWVCHKCVEYKARFASNVSQGVTEAGTEEAWEV